MLCSALSNTKVSGSRLTKTEFLRNAKVFKKTSVQNAETLARMTKFKLQQYDQQQSDLLEVSVDLAILQENEERVLMAQN